MKIRKIISLFVATAFTVNFSFNNIVYAEEFYDSDYILREEAEFSINDYKGSGEEDFKYEIGNIPVLISAPHTVKQLREGKTKSEDSYTGAMIKTLQKTTGAHIIYKTSTNGDENYTTEETEYRKALSEIVKNNNVRIVFDLHGMARSRLSDIDIGTGNIYHINLLKQNFILPTITSSLLDTNATINKYFFGGKPYTISTYASQRLGVPAVQLEINKEFRSEDGEKFTYMIDKLTDMIKDITEECYNVKVKSLKVLDFNTSSVHLSWDKIPGVSQYEIYVSNEDGGNYQKIDTVENNTYIHNNLDSGQTYFYKVKGVTSDYSSSIEATTLCEAPKVNLEANKSKTIEINWNNVNNADGYEILRKAENEKDYTQIANIEDKETLSFTDENLQTDKTYYYKVRAYKYFKEEKLYSDYSQEENIKTKLSKPEINVTAGERKIDLNWKKVDDATGYEIYRATSKSGKYSKVKTITNNRTLNYTNSNLTSGKTYYYKIIAYKDMDENKVYSDYSIIKSATAKLPTPSISLTSGTRKVYLKWKKVNDATGYEIYRATSKSGKYSKIKTITKGTTVSYTNSNLSSKKTYYYKKRAYKTMSNKKVYSSYSAVKNIKTK